MFLVHVIQADSIVNIPLQGAETSCMRVCTKRVCLKFTEPKVCTVGLYST